MRFRPRHEAMSIPTDLPMTSMIDVVFLLLIFFMLTSTWARERELQSTLDAERDGGGAAAGFAPQIVDVEMRDGAPGYRIGARVFRDAEALALVLAELPKDGGVFVRSAGDVPWGWSAAALQASHDAGFERRTYVARD